MIDRYSTDRIKKIWSIESKFKTYLKVELATLEVWSKKNKVPEKDFLLIKKNAKLNLKRLFEIEQETKHDVVAFVKSISESLGSEGKWFHYGLTSTDVVDTAYAIQLKESNKFILDNLIKFSEILKLKAFKYKDTPIIGRTHGIHAEITSLGLKFALWYDEMQRNIKRFKFAAAEVETGKISGSVGNFVNTPSEIQDEVCKNLKLNSAKISTQILQRDIHANYISTLAIIGTTLEKIAFEIRNSQRTEVGELMEFFDKNQKGSSSMPHKKNPIASENIVGIARLLRGYVIPALENNALWYERDISHSSVERVIIPDVINLIDYSLTRYGKIINNLLINEMKINSNIDLTNGVIFSQRILNFLIENNFSRDEAYKIVQSLSLKSFDEDRSFFELLWNHEKINKNFKKEDILNLFDKKYFLKEVDVIFRRVFDVKEINF